MNPLVSKVRIVRSASWATSFNAAVQRRVLVNNTWLSTATPTFDSTAKRLRPKSVMATEDSSLA